MIKKVLICGLGALGLTYANKLKDICNLRILADEDRIRKFKEIPKFLGIFFYIFNVFNPYFKSERDLLKQIEKAIRYEKQILYGETNGLSHVYFTILLGIVCDIFLLGLFRVIEVALLIPVIVFLLNYLCLPLYLGMRERTW